MVAKDVQDEAVRQGAKRKTTIMDIWKESGRGCKRSSSMEADDLLLHSQRQFSQNDLMMTEFISK